MKIRAENLPETHFLRATADGALGEFLAALGNYSEAEPLLLKSYQSLNQTQIPDSPRIKTARQRVVALYEKWGKPERASEYRSSL